MDYEGRIKSLKLEIPPPPKPVGSYHPFVVSGHQVFLSGQISRLADGRLICGKVGSDLTLEQGQQAARAAALNAVSILRHLVGFEKFNKMIRLTGYVQTAPDFYDISTVVNGASDLFVDIFGDKGMHARSAVGTAGLPLNAAVEIEVAVQLKR